MEVEPPSVSLSGVRISRERIGRYPLPRHEAATAPLVSNDLVVCRAKERG